MVGLDAAGKTTILYKLKLGEIVTTIPTIGTDILLLFKSSLFTVEWLFCQLVVNSACYSLINLDTIFSMVF